MRMGGMVSLPPLPCQWPDDPLGWPRSARERKETCMSQTRGWTVPSGIGGWLYLVALGLCLTPVRLVLEIGRGLRLLDPATWHAVTTPVRPAYHPLFGPLIVGELAANGILLLWTFGLLYLYFTRRRIFPPRDGYLPHRARADPSGRSPGGPAHPRRGRRHWPERVQRSRRQSGAGARVGAVLPQVTARGQHLRALGGTRTWSVSWRDHARLGPLPCRGVLASWVAFRATPIDNHRACPARAASW